MKVFVVVDYDTMPEKAVRQGGMQRARGCRKISFPERI
jgi:hypothetical protein